MDAPGDHGHPAKNSEPVISLHLQFKHFILEMREAELREVERVASGHTAVRWKWLTLEAHAPNGQTAGHRQEDTRGSWPPALCGVLGALNNW